MIIQKSYFTQDVVYLNTVGDDTTSQKNATTTWNVQVTINKMVLLFKVDTGAEVTAMSESAWKQLNSIKKFTTFVAQTENH